MSHKLKEIAEFPNAKDIITIDGMRVEYDDGFGLVRASNTTPVLVLRFEGHTQEALERIQKEVLAQAPAREAGHHVHVRPLSGASLSGPSLAGSLDRGMGHSPLSSDSFKERLARAVFSTVLRLATPAYLARVLLRGRVEPLYAVHPGERFGFGEAIAPGAIWVHAVSLGETRAAAALIERLRQERPGMRLLLTHTTATGREAGRALLRDGDTQRWLPFDTPGAVRRFLQAHAAVGRRADGNRDLAQRAARDAEGGRADGARECAAVCAQPASRREVQGAAGAGGAQPAAGAGADGGRCRSAASGWRRGRARLRQPEVRPPAR